jgi:hypothetical protein
MDKIFYLFGIIIVVYLVSGIILNFLGIYSLFIVSLILFLFYNFKNAANYNITDKHWRLFALVGSVATGSTLLINGLNVFKSSKETNLQNMDNFNKLGLDVTRDIEETFMKYRKELGYLFNDIYGVIGKQQVNDYVSTRNLDMEYLAALKIFKSIETVFLVGLSVYGIDKITDPDFQGVSSTMQTIFGSNLMKKYWVELKPLFQDDMAAIFDNLMIYGRISK